MTIIKVMLYAQPPSDQKLMLATFALMSIDVLVFCALQIPSIVNSIGSEPTYRTDGEIPTRINVS